MLRAVVVDDERPSLIKLAKLIGDSGMAEVTGKFTKPLEAIRFLKENTADAIFLDIEMPEMSGIELANHIIGFQKSAAIVFVTAYNQYAVEAFRLNAIDYVMKPVSSDRIEETLKRILSIRGNYFTTKALSISCFGKFTVSSGNGEIKFRTGKAEELLAFMLDRRGSFISRSQIIDSLWADFDGDRALVHFNTTLHYVKKALLEYGLNIPFTYNRGGYQFDFKGLDCDYLKFSAFLGQDKIPSQGNIMEFEKTAKLFRGEYLSGWDCDWAAVRRLILEEQFIQMLLRMAQFYEAAGEASKAEGWLKKGLMMEPLHREMNYSLIGLLLQSNETAMAKRYYEIYCDGLKTKFGHEPDAAFRELFA